MKKTILLPIFFFINTIQSAAEHNIAIPQEIILYKMIPRIEYSPEEPINEVFRTLQNCALVSRFFYNNLKSTAFVNPDLLEKITEFKKFLTADEETFTNKQIRLLTEWKNPLFPHDFSLIHLGTLIFNKELIHNTRDYMKKNKTNISAWYIDNWFVWATKKPIQFYVENDQVITDNPKVKVLDLPEKNHLITYTTCEYTEKIHYLYYKMLIYCGLESHHVFNRINFVIENNGITQDTLLTHCLKKLLPKTIKTSYVKVHHIILLLKFPELLINKTNGQGKTPLELACEDYIHWYQEDNEERIASYAHIIQLIINHPLFDPEVQNSEGLNAYELLEQYKLTGFFNN